MSTRTTTLKELRDMNLTQLQVLLHEKETAYHAALLKVHAKEQSNVRMLRSQKKDMARVQTILRAITPQ